MNDENATEPVSANPFLVLIVEKVKAWITAHADDVLSFLMQILAERFTASPELQAAAEAFRTNPGCETLCALTKEISEGDQEQLAVQVINAATV